MEPISLTLLALGAAGLGWAALSSRPGPSGGAAAKDLAKRVANQGPQGEWVFKPEIADSLVKSLAGQTYQYVDPNLDDTVKIAPDPRGNPIPVERTSLAWARQQNSRLSILAPLYLATSTPQKRFLRAVKAGQEHNYTGPETGFAVLLYAGTIDRNEAPPGRPPGGGAIQPLPQGELPTPPRAQPGLPNLPPPGPAGGGGFPGGLGIPGLAPASFIPGAEAAIQGSVKKALDDLCANGRDPAAMEAVAAQVEQFGFTSEAACLRARAAQLRAQQQPPPAPPPAPPQPGGFTPVGPFPPQPAPPPPQPQIPPPVTQPQFAVVTTQDAPPAGDLIIRRTPSMSGPTLQFPQGQGAANQIGGAEKNGTVAVLSRITAEGIDWAEIQWSGGTGRTSPLGWPAARGFAKSQFLRASAQSPVAPAPFSVPGLVTSSFPGVNVGPAQILSGPRARVTTNDPPPSGDLIIRSGPSMSAGQIGGAEKNGLVDLLGLPQSAEGFLWQQVNWGGGSRRPASSGWVKAQFLVPVSPTTVSGSGQSQGAGPRIIENLVSGEGRAATVASAAGMRLRHAPGPQGRTLSLIPAGTRVQLLQVAPGLKGDERSPGPGGWARILYEGKPGWVQSEWLVLS